MMYNTQKEIAMQELLNLFRRKLPDSPIYHARLKRELQLIQKFGFQKVFAQVREILDLASDMPHSTRGSAGSSLVCYLLGITDFDPILNKCVLSRFMHEYRQDLPDIDIDFPYNTRDELINRIKNKYPNRVARISNKVRFHESSAVRQALRDHGYRKFLPRHYDLEEIAGSKKESVLKRAQEILGQLWHYSLHCGGIVIFDESVPEHLKLNNEQIKLDKDEVEQAGLIKIDLLCNRGLAQLVDLGMHSLDQYDPHDEQTAKIFSTGNTFGVTFSESPALKKLFLESLPRNRNDIIFALAMIRPAPAVDGRKERVIQQLHSVGHTKGHVVTDDDAIEMIQEVIGCSEAEAEVYRKAYAKENIKLMQEFADKLGEHPIREWLLHNLKYLALYSFCRGHSISLGRIAWALAYEKTRQPHKFWTAALNHAQTMYRPWVHVQEAKRAGLKFGNFGRGPWQLDHHTLWCQNPDRGYSDGWSQYMKRGYWTSNRFMPNITWKTNGDKVQFRSLIATGRYHTAYDREITYLTVGYDTGKFGELTINYSFPFDRWDGVQGKGRFYNGSVLVDHIEGFKVINVLKPQQLTFDLS